ncbi:MAG: PAS domain S-box protein [Anaerolineae bacterium]|nr:PAS domain S-box protein [Anaerolineae bacterium]
MGLHVMVSFIALVSYGGLLILAFSRKPGKSRPSQIFVFYLLDMVLVQTAYLMLSLANSAKEALLWYTLIIPVMSGQSIIYFFFTRAFLGLGHSPRLVWSGVLLWMMIVFLAVFGRQALYTGIYRDETAGLFVPEYGTLVPVLAVPILVFMGGAVFDLARGYRRTRSSLQRVRIQYLMLSVFVIWTGTAANLSPAMRAYPVDVLANVAGAFLIAYAILRYQLLDIQIVVRQGLLYAILAAILGAGSFTIIYFAVRLFHDLSIAQILIVSFVVAIIAAIVIQALRDRTQRWIDRLFFPDKYDGNVMIQTLSRTVTSVLDLQKLAKMILDEITGTMHVRWASLFLEQDGSQDWQVFQKGLDTAIGLRLKKEHPILQWLSDHEGALTADALDDMLEREVLQSQDVDALAKIELSLLIPLRARGKITGVLGVGPKVSRRSYSQDDERTMITLANQTAVAIDNARLHEAVQQELAERRRAEAEILRLQHLLQNIADSMPSALITLDATGLVLTWNPAAEILTGQPEIQVQGHLLWRVCPELGRYRDLFEYVIQEGRVAHRNRELVSTQGGTVYRDVSVFPLKADDVAGGVMRIDDVTRRVQLEELMVQSAKMASVGGLAAGVAHEINNPLSVMLQSTQMIQMAFDTQRPRTVGRLEKVGLDAKAFGHYLQTCDVYEYLDGIQDAGRRAAKIVSDLLSFSHKGSSEIAPYDLNGLVEKTLALASIDYDLKKKVDLKDIEIVRELDAGLPEVLCDGQQIQQVILNLVQNAAQAMAQKTKSDREYKPRLMLRTWLVSDSSSLAHTERTFVRVEVEDNGPGIPQAVRMRLFEPFFTTKEVGEGTGLGLWLCWSIIVERHGGQIEVESGREGGARFVIALPVAGKQDGEMQE